MANRQTVYEWPEDARSCGQILDDALNLRDDLIVWLSGLDMLEEFVELHDDWVFTDSGIVPKHRVFGDG